LGYGSFTNQEQALQAAGAIAVYNGGSYVLDRSASEIEVIDPLNHSITKYGNLTWGERVDSKRFRNCVLGGGVPLVQVLDSWFGQVSKNLVHEYNKYYRKFDVIKY